MVFQVAKLAIFCAFFVICAPLGSRTRRKSFRILHSRYGTKKKKSNQKLTTRLPKWRPHEFPLVGRRYDKGSFKRLSFRLFLKISLKYKIYLRIIKSTFFQCVRNGTQFKRTYTHKSNCTNKNIINNLSIYRGGGATHSLGPPWCSRGKQYHYLTRISIKKKRCYSVNESD